MVDIKIGKFDIHRSILNSIAYACQDREFSEEVDLLEKYGGYSWIENGLKTDLINGISADDDDLE